MDVLYIPPTETMLLPSYETTKLKNDITSMAHDVFSI
jgi:hypothetical protein